MRERIKIMLALLLACLCAVNSGLAAEQNSLFVKVFSLDADSEISFAASADLRKLYPYTDEQTAIYGRALSHMLLRYLASDREGKTFSSIDVSYAEEPLFSQVEFQAQGEYYSLNSLLDKRLVKADRSNALYDVSENPFDMELIFDSDKAREELRTQLESMPALAERKKGSVSVKGFPKASYAATSKLNKDTIAEHAESISSILLAGFAKEYQQELYPELFGAWEIKQFYDSQETLVGLRFSGDAMIQEAKHSVTYSFHRTADFSVYEIQLLCKQNRNNYVSLTLRYDKEGTKYRSEYIAAVKGELTRQTVESDLRLQEGEGNNSLEGSFLCSEDKGEEQPGKSIELKPQLGIVKNGSRRSLTGDLGLKISKNNATIIEADIHFQDNSNTEKLEKFAHAMDVANQHGGIDKNVNYIQSVVKNYYDEVEQDYKLLDMNQYSDLLLEGLRTEVIENFSARLLKAMLKQEDNSAYILSYGMQQSDWEAFLNYYNSNKEE